MAYNNGFPMNYNYYQQPMMQPQMQVPQQAPQVQQAPQYPIVQSGFVRVRDENEARMYPVAPGNSITFVNENSPYCYTKTVNMGQLDRPIFEKYRLVKEEDAPAEAQEKPAGDGGVDMSKYVLKTDMAAFKGEIDAIRADIETFRSDLYGIAGKKKAKKEATVDE